MLRRELRRWVVSIHAVVGRVSVSGVDWDYVGPCSRVLQAFGLEQYPCVVSHSKESDLEWKKGPFCWNVTSIYILASPLRSLHQSVRPSWRDFHVLVCTALLTHISFFCRACMGTGWFVGLEHERTWSFLAHVLEEMGGPTRLLQAPKPNPALLSQGYYLPYAILWPTLSVTTRNGRSYVVF